MDVVFCKKISKIVSSLNRQCRAGWNHSLYFNHRQITRETIFGGYLSMIADLLADPVREKMHKSIDLFPGLVLVAKTLVNESTKRGKHVL